MIRGPEPTFTCDIHRLVSQQFSPGAPEDLFLYPPGDYTGVDLPKLMHINSSHVHHACNILRSLQRPPTFKFTLAQSEQAPSFHNGSTALTDWMIDQTTIHRTFKHAATPDGDGTTDRATLECRDEHESSPSPLARTQLLVGALRINASFLHSEAVWAQYGIIGAKWVGQATPFAPVREHVMNEYTPFNSSQH